MFETLAVRVLLWVVVTGHLAATLFVNFSMQLGETTFLCLTICLIWEPKEQSMTARLNALVRHLVPTNPETASRCFMSFQDALPNGKQRLIPSTILLSRRLSHTNRGHKMNCANQAGLLKRCLSLASWIGVLLAGITASIIIRQINVAMLNLVYGSASASRSIGGAYYLYIYRTSLLDWLAVFVLVVLLASYYSGKSSVHFESSAACRKAMLRGIVFFVGMCWLVPYEVVPWQGGWATFLMIAGFVTGKGPVEMFYLVPSLVLDAAMFAVAGTASSLASVDRPSVAAYYVRWMTTVAALVMFPVIRMLVIDSEWGKSIPFIALDAVVLGLSVVLWLWVRKGILGTSEQS